MLLWKWVRFGLVLIVLMVAVAWFLKPPTVRQSLEGSGVHLIKRQRDEYDAFAEASEKTGFYSVNGMARPDIVSALKKAGFRTEVGYATGTATVSSVQIHVVISQFIRQNHLLPFLGKQRARLVTCPTWTRLYFDPDIN